MRPDAPRLTFARYRFGTLVLMAAVICGAAAALVVLAWGSGGTYRWGGIRITVNDFSRPLILGLLGIAGILLLDGGRNRIRRSFALATLVAFAALGILCAAREVPPIVTDSDFAVTELYTELASGGRLLVGPYSRYGWNHPGPIYFYAQAPFYVLGGRDAATLYSVAVAINIAAVLTILFTTGRAERGPLLIVLAMVGLGLAWRLPRLLASPWTAHVPVLSSLAFVVVAAAVISGRIRLLPVAALLGSFIAQTHLGFVPLVALLSGVAIVAVILHGRRNRQNLWPVLTSAGAVWLLVWLLPLSEALSHSGGNLAAVLQFFVSDAHPSQPFSVAVLSWSYGLSGILRSDLALPWGGHFTSNHGAWIVAVALAQVIALIVVSVRDLKQGRVFAASLAGCAFLSSVIGLWATAQIRGDVLDHEVFGLVSLGTLNLAIISAACLRPIAGRRMAAWLLSPGNSGFLSALIVIATVHIGVQHFRDLTSYELRQAEKARIPATYAVIRDYLQTNEVRKPLIEIEGTTAWAEAAGILLRLHQEGMPLSVTRPSLSMFTITFRSDGDEDALLSISSHEGLHERKRSRPGNVVLRDRHPLYVNIVRPNHLPRDSVR